jgi:methionine-rich copper-binding protein CopC
MPIKRILLASTFATAVATAAGAQAHARLESSEPQAAATLDSAPKQIRLKFNEALEPAFSKIKLTDASNAEVPLPPAKVDAADASTMSVPTPILRAGAYHVQWSTMTHDGHKAKGEFVFTVK